MTVEVVEKYLDRHAEPEAADLTLPTSYDHSLVIPSHQETSASLKAVWQKIPEHISLLVTIVVNSSKPSTESEIKLFGELMNADLIPYHYIGRKRLITRQALEDFSQFHYENGFVGPLEVADDFQSAALLTLEVADD